MMPLVFELIIMLALLVLGFVCGRVWEIRRELRQRSQRLDDNAGSMIPTAQIPIVVDTRTGDAIF